MFVTERGYVIKRQGSCVSYEMKIEGCMFWQLNGKPQTKITIAATISNYNSHRICHYSRLLGIAVISVLPLKLSKHSCILVRLCLFSRPREPPGPGQPLFSVFLPFGGSTLHSWHANTRNRIKHSDRCSISRKAFSLEKFRRTWVWNFVNNIPLVLE